MTPTPSALSVRTLLCVFGLLFTTISYAQDRFVAVGGNDTGDCSGSGSPCATINYAISQATAGDVIEVAAGTYDEVVTIDKPLSLLGPNATTSAVTGTRAAEARLLQRININGTTTQDVTISGFEFFEVPAPTWTIYIQGDSDNFTFENNRFIDCEKDAIRSGISSNTANVTVRGNLIQGITEPVASGILLGGINGTSVISNNEIDLAISGTPTGYAGIQTPNATGLTISGNEISNTTNQGLQLAGDCGDVVIENNTISNTNTSNGGDKGAIRLYGTDFIGPITITGNVLTSSFNGIAVRNTEDITGQDIVIENNDLSGNSNASIYNGASAGALNASCNWHGSADPVTITAGITGDVTFEPFLTTGGNSIASGPGFSPTGDCIGCASGGFTTVTNMDTGESFCSIQAAIDDTDTDAGDIIVVGAGTYEEQINVYKAVDLRGPNYGVSPNSPGRNPEAIIVPPSNLIDLGAANPEWDFAYLVAFYNDANGIKMDGFTINGDNPNISGFVYAGMDIEATLGVYSEGLDDIEFTNNIVENFTYMGFWAANGFGNSSQNLTLSDNKINNVHDLNGLGFGFGTYIQATDGVITNNVVTNVRNGIQVQPYTVMGSGMVSNNSFEVYNLGMWYNYAENNGSGSWTMENNSVLGVNPPAATGGALTWSGIAVQTMRPGAGPVTFEGNFVDGGVVSSASANWSDVIGYRVRTPNENATDINTFTNNSITNVETFINNQTTQEVNATCNWYGTAVFADIASGITGSVDFIPYLNDGTDDDAGTAGFQPVAGSCIDGPVRVYEDAALTMLVNGYTTIQAAIDDGTTLDGYFVTVDAGTYDEAISIDKSLTILGPNESESPNTGTRVAEAILAPTGANVQAITGSAPNKTIVIKGITIDMSGATDNARFATQISQDGTIWTFEHNIFTNSAGAVNGDIYFSGNQSVTFSLIDNLIRDGSPSNGFSFWSQQPHIFTITDNVWEDNAAWALNLNRATGIISDNIIRNTSVTGPAWFDDQLGIIVATDGNDLTITRNRFENIPHIALNIYQNFDGTLNVTNNEFIDIGQSRVDMTVGVAAVRFREDSGTFGNLAGISVSENTFLNNVTTIDNTSGQTLLAECNYWGTTDAPTIDAGIIGGNVDYVPYLINGTDDDAVTPGFQPAPLSCAGGCPGGVAVINTNTGESFCSIQDAIDDTDTENGHTLEAIAGTYDENITVNKSLTINGPNAGIACGSRGAEAILAPAAGTPVRIIADGVTLNGFEVTAPDAFNAINLNNTSNTTVTYNNVHHIGTNITGVASQNIHAIINQLGATASSNVTISDNCIENLGTPTFSTKSLSAIGILQSTTTGVLTGLNITGNVINNLDVNTADWPDGKIAYGILINVGGGSSYLTTTGEVQNAVISNNEISNLSGFISTGIGLEGNTKDAVVRNNSVSNLAGRKFSGDRAGGAYDLSGLKFENNRWASTVTVEDNSFAAETFVHDGTTGRGYAISNYVPVGTTFAAGGGGTTTGEVTISCNWLGSATYGDLLDNATFTGKVFNKDNCVTNFVPFLVDNTDDAATVGFQPAPMSCTGGPVRVFDELGDFVAAYVEIQTAIEDASTMSGYTVRISSGTYVENVDAVTDGKDLTFAPGASPGCVTIMGDFELNAGDVLEIEIEGTTACTEHDQFIVTGTVTLGGATITTPLGMYLAQAGDEIVIIDGSSAIGGTFAEGNFVTDGVNTYYIDYAAGVDGFDVVLTKCCDGLLDLGIFNYAETSPVGNKLQVFVRPGNDVINGFYSAGIFTIRTLATGVTFTKLGGGLSPYDYNQVGAPVTDGGYTYYFFNFVYSGTMSNTDWTAGTEYLLLTLSYDCIGDAEFELTNDPFALANNGGYYQELGGAEAQGVFYEPTVTSPTGVSITADNSGAICETAAMDIDLSSMTSDGTAPYTYAWSGPDSYTSTAADPAPFASTLASGVYTYTVIVTDANGCTATATTDVTVLDNADCVENVTLTTYYPTITEAIDATETVDGHELFVPAANWPENVNVTKALTINGANAGLSCDDAGRGAESIILGTTVVTIASDGVTLDGFTLEGITGIASAGFEDVNLVNNNINARQFGISTSLVNTSAGNGYTIQDNCINFCDQVFDTEGFSTDPVLSPTQAAGVWYTDRYAPAGFVAEVFGGNSRLKHSIAEGDAQTNGFNNTQGRKYDISGTTAMSIEVYIPSDWATTGRRMAGFWGTAVDAGSAISAYPIIEFTSEDGTPRFRGWNDANGWIDLGLPTGFVYDEFYTLEIALLPSDEFMYSVGDKSVAVSALGSVAIDNVILQGHNTASPGVTYDIYWDNLNTFCAPVTENSPTVGITLAGASGTEAVVLQDNNVTDGFYGYVLGGVTTTGPTTVRGGEYTDIMQGVAVFNTLDGANFIPSTVGVADLSMTSFSGDYPAIPRANFHSGVYVFTGGADPLGVVDIAVDNVIVSNTGKISPNSSGIHFADFSNGAGNRLNAVVTDSEISNNLNRGVYVRGVNATTTVNNNDILFNGADPHGTGGNNGFGIIVNNEAAITLNNNTITNPPSQIGTFPVTAMFIGVGPAGSITAFENSINGNGNANGSLTANTYPIAQFTATCNWWTSDDIDVVDGLVDGNVLFVPYLNDGTDTDAGARGFVPTAGSCVNPTAWYVNDDALTDDVFTDGLGSDANQGTRRRPFRTIGKAVMTVETTTSPVPGPDNNTIFVDAGSYDEQVVVPNTVNGLTLQGVGPCDDLGSALATTLDFTGTVTGKPTLLDIAGDGTVIDGIQFNVDLTNLHSAIIASDAGLDDITVQNNCIDPYQSTPGTYLSGYGPRNAISINYAGFRVASGGVDNILVDNNRVSTTLVGSILGDGDDIAFRSAVSVDEGAGIYTRNTFHTINHDVLVRFNSNGDVIIGGSVANANTFNGGGVQYAEPNAGGGTVTISHNAFDGSSTDGSVLRLQNNKNDAAVTVSDNTLLNLRWGMSLENFRNVTVSDNVLSPLAGFNDFRLITVNTKSISSNSATIDQYEINGVFTGNAFNSNGDDTGTAMAFYNHDNDNADLGFFTVGTAGSPNVFAPGFEFAVYLGDQLGSTLAAIADFPEYDLGAGSDTDMACWDRDIDVQNNTFDIGAGAQLPATMDNTERTALEVILYHLPDNACLGELIYFDPVLVEAKVFLQGPYDSVSGMMNDDLRAAMPTSLIPLTEPHTSINTAHAGSFVEVNNFVTETIAASVLDVTGPDAIVDWVWLELRDMSNSDTKVATRSALVQRDGDIVDLDGVSAVEFPDTYVGQYYLLVRHRNHLGAMTASPVDFTAVMPIDFTVAAEPTFGATATSARRLVKTGIYGLWAGNVLPYPSMLIGFNVKYNGGSNDRLPILTAVGDMTPLNIVPNTYQLEDVNMDGQVKYNGSRNDRVIILQNVGPADPLNTITQEPNN